jgi:uncharacterized membrane protein
LNPAELPRRTALAALLIAGCVMAGWLGPAAFRAGALALVALALALLPIALGVRGLARANLRTGRWLSLVLPFYGAALLVAAVGNPGARAWVTAGAFAVALSFAAVISWVRRSSQTPPPPPR